MARQHLLAGWVLSSWQLSLPLGMALMMWSLMGFPQEAACLGALAPCCLPLGSSHVRSGSAGLDFSSSQLSLPLSISGVALMVWSLVFFPMVQRCLGARTCAVFGLAATVFLSVALGCTSYLAQAHTSVSGIIVALTVIMVLKACFQQLCFPTSMVRCSSCDSTGGPWCAITPVYRPRLHLLAGCCPCQPVWDCYRPENSCDVHGML